MSIQSEIKKLEQGRAEFAYKCVKEAVKKFKSDTKRQKEYRSYSLKIPIMILTNGLGQTLAFVKAIEPACSSPCFGPKTRER